MTTTNFIHQDIQDHLSNEDFLLAMSIICKHINVNISINEVTEHVSTGKILVINSSPAGLISELVQNGFSLYPYEDRKGVFSKTGIHVIKF